MFELLVVGGAALGAYGWERLRRARAARRYAQALRLLDDEAQVALHLAEREAGQRGQPLTPVHLAYALAQDEGVGALLRAVEGDPAALEARALAALDEPWPPARAREAFAAQREVAMILGSALASARARGGQATCADLCARLVLTSGARVLEGAGVDALALQFRCVHGHPPPPLERPGEPTVHVVIRNDDVTTAQLVYRLLQDELGVDAARAAALTQACHAEGKAIVGAFPAADARARLERARARVRAARAPLWIGVEPV